MKYRIMAAYVAVAAAVVVAAWLLLLKYQREQIDAAVGLVGGVLAGGLPG